MARQKRWPSVPQPFLRPVVCRLPIGYFVPKVDSRFALSTFRLPLLFRDDNATQCITTDLIAPLWEHSLPTLRFQPLTNPSSRKPFVFTSIQNPGCPPWVLRSSEYSVLLSPGLPNIFSNL